MQDWIMTKPRRRALRRNWGLYVLRGMLANTKHLSGVMSAFGYTHLCNALRDAIFELEQQYPNSPGPKTIKKRSFTC